MNKQMWDESSKGPPMSQPLMEMEVQQPKNWSSFKKYRACKAHPENCEHYNQS